MTEERRDIFATLQRIAQEAPEEGRTLAEIVDRLDERAFGAALFLFALPCSIPFLVGVPQVMAAPILVLTLQMAGGRREPWLPARLGARRIARKNINRAVGFGQRWLGWVVRMARPRCGMLFSARGERVCGVALTGIGSALLVPFPGSDSLPGIAIAVSAVGLMARDGFIVIFGWLIGLAWFVIWGLIAVMGLSWLA